MYEQGKVIETAKAGPLNDDNMGVSFHEAMKGIKNELQRRYPYSTLVYFASDRMPEQANGTIVRYNSFGEYGDKTLNDTTGTDLAANDDRAFHFCRNVFMNIIANWQRKECVNREMVELHNAALRYASSIGLDSQGLEHFQIRTPEPEKPKFIHTMGQKVAYDDNLEAHISEVEKELARLVAMRSPSNLIPLLRSEEKRLRKNGDLKAADAKRKEIETLETTARRLLEAERHKIEVRKKKQAALAKARATLKSIREQRREEKRMEAERLAQAEKDRQRGYKQFQPGKAAKAKMAKIKERQAEKKRKSAGCGETTVRSCSPLLKIQ